MPVIFYDHLVPRHEVLLIIEKIEAQDNHKGKMRQLADDIIHQGIVSFILGKLHEQYHQRFLRHLHESPYDPEILVFLREKTTAEIDEEIKKEGDRLVALIKEDLIS